MDSYKSKIKKDIDDVQKLLHGIEVNTEIKCEQIIYYGAPGTGKSFFVDKKANIDNSVRTTFHPDSDYASFVGAYKPTMVKRSVLPSSAHQLDGDQYGSSESHLQESTIVYKFIPQAFLKAYVEAWKRYIEATDNGREIRPYYLVIEEINRGNCAQIFGDIFQLLDRCKYGNSSYAVSPDVDIETFLRDDEKGFAELKITVDRVIRNDSDKIIATFSKIKDGSVMVLPPNLYILATMNTSDQSLFPIDSAFKRRWDWQYMKIKDANKEWKIDFQNEENGPKIDWWIFIQKINRIIADMTSSADKQLGYFFCKADEIDKENPTENQEATIISKEKFVGKVLFYLWNDVFKDYGFDDADLFTFEVNGTERIINFPDFYNDDNEVNNTVVMAFINNVLKWNKDGNKA